MVIGEKVEELFKDIIKEIKEFHKNFMRVRRRFRKSAISPQRLGPQKTYCTF